MLLNFHRLVNFPVLLLLLISGFIPLWSENILGMISVFLNLCGTCFQTRYKLYLLKASRAPRKADSVEGDEHAGSLLRKF